MSAQNLLVNAANGNILSNRGQKRRLEAVADNNANIRQGVSDSLLKKRKTNSLVSCATEPARDIPAAPVKPEKPKRSLVTDFDRQQFQESAGLYMPEEYVRTIVEALEEEHNDKRLPDYFDQVQNDVKPRMRTILCGWITEVCLKFEMSDIVLWTTFQLIDRYLATTDIMRSNFQLLGCAAIWVAAKFHEIYPPMSQDLVHMSDGAFDKHQLIKMESELLDKLGYNLTMKTPFQFLERFTDIALHGIHPKAHAQLSHHLATNPSAAKVSAIVKTAKRIKFLARYTLERYNLAPESVGRPVKHMAAMALYTALSLTSNSWTEELAQASGFSEEDLRSDDFEGGSFKDFKQVVLKFEEDAHKSAIRKYTSSKFGRVSTLRKKEKR